MILFDGYYFGIIVILVSYNLILQRAIRSVLTRDDFKRKFILTSVLKGCKEFLSTFRTEERRKVFFIASYIDINTVEPQSYDYVLVPVVFLVCIAIANRYTAKCYNAFPPKDFRSPTL